MMKKLTFLFFAILTSLGAVASSPHHDDTNVAKIDQTEYATLQEAINAATAGQTVTLLQDMTLAASQTVDGNGSYAIVINKSITLDGNEHTLTSTATRAIGIKGESSDNKIDVTIKNLTVNNAQNGGSGIFTRGNLNSLSLDNVKLTITSTSDYNQPLTISGNAGTAETNNTVNVTVNNCNFQSSPNCECGYAIINWVPANINIQSSTIKGWACLYAKPNSKGTVYTVNQSELISANQNAGNTNTFGVIVIEDDYVTVNVTNTTINVSGNQNTQSIVTFNCIYATASNNDISHSTVTLGEGNIVSMLADANFVTNSSNDGIAQGGTISISAGSFDKAVPEQYCAAGMIPTTVDGGSYSVKIGSYVAQNTTTLEKYETLADAVAGAQADEVIQMIANTTLASVVNVNTPITIDLNGYTITREKNVLNVSADLTITDNSQSGDGSIQGTGSSGYGAVVRNGATLTIDNAKVSGQQVGVYLYNGHLVVDNNAEVTSSKYAVYSKNTTTNTAIVNSGTVTGSDSGVCMFVGSLTMNGGTISSPDRGVYLQNAAAIVNDGTINGTNCGVSLFSSASFTLNDGTVQSEGIGIANNGTIQSPGTTIQIHGGSVIAVGHLGIYHPGMGNLTIDGGELTAGTGIVMRNGKLTISSGTIHATGDYQAYDYHSNGSCNTGDALQIERSNYGNHIGENFNGTTYSGTEVSITGGTFISDNAEPVASYIKADDSTKTGDGTARAEHFISGGWYSKTIYQNYCVEGIECATTQDADAPNEAAPYTVVVNSITLTDSEPYERVETVSAGQVTYSRTFSATQANKYQAWFVPFDYVYQAADADKFTFYKINLISASTEPGVVEDNTAVFINIEAVETGKTLKANRPYLVKPANEGTIDFVATNVDLLGKDNTSRLKMSTSAFEYNFYGNYDTYTAEDSEMLVMNGGKICWTGEAATLGAYRWYIRVVSNYGDDDYTKIHFSFVNGEADEATDIADVNIADDQIDCFYSMDGIRKNGLTKGLNIVKYKSGKTKKIFVK